MKEFQAIIHCGVWGSETEDPIILERRADQLKSLQTIIDDCAGMLNAGQNAINVATHAILRMEENPLFNAGIGAEIGSEGQIELDASIMDGNTLDCGAVTGVEHYANPINIARIVMEETSQVFLSKEGAHRLAEEHGFQRIALPQFYTEYTQYLLQKWKEDQQAKVPTGTVGAVVRDNNGNIAAGTSTGGFTGKIPGRIGDSPIIGAGTYADNRYGGASATGVGEQIIKTALTRLALDYIKHRRFEAQGACNRAIDELGKLKNGLGGIILIDHKGRIGAQTNMFAIPRAYVTDKMKQSKVETQIRG